MALFLVGSSLSGAASTFGALVAFRAVQGLGAGALQPMAMTISADLYRLDERAKVQAFSTAVWGLSNVVGPILGGWIVEHASWRWVFFVNVPVGALAVSLLMASYRDPVRERGGSFGMTGATIAGAATTLSCFALAPGGIPSLARWGVALAAAMAVTGLVRHQLSSAAPLLARSALAHPEVRAGLFAGGCLGAILYSCSAYVPLWIVAHGRGDALTGGATLVALLAGWAVGSGVSVRLLVAHGMRAILLCGFALQVAGAAALTAVAFCAGPTVWALAALSLLGLGMGPVASASILSPQSRVGWADRGALTSALFACRMLGGSVAVAALNAGALGAHDVTRFGAIAILGALGFVLSAAMAPTGERIRADEAALLA
jgi:MFS family permease